MLLDTDTRPIVLDNGSHNIKAGYAGESNPRILVPTLVAQCSTPLGHTDWYVGEHARALRRHLPLSCPIAKGVVTNVDELSVIWHYLYSKELRVNSADHPVLLIERPLLPSAHRTTLAELAFEKFTVPAFYYSNQGVLSLYASGLTSGLSVDIGKDILTVIPASETFTVRDAVKHHHLGGGNVTTHLQQLLISANPEVSHFITTEATQFFKEKLCYISPTPITESTPLIDMKPVKFQAPDGHIVGIGKERMLAPEILFQPNQGGLECPGVHYAIKTAIEDSPDQLRSFMCANIVLSGGSTMFPGFPQRLEREMMKLFPTNKRVRIWAPEHRKYTVWIGGSILASLDSFSNIWITKAEYEENGADIVNQKCPQ